MLLPQSPPQVSPQNMPELSCPLPGLKGIAIPHIAVCANTRVHCPGRLIHMKPSWVSTMRPALVFSSCHPPNSGA